MNRMSTRYQKPTLQYWTVRELNAIEATMSGGGGSGGGTSKPSSDYVFTVFPKNTTAWSSLPEETKSVSQIIVEQEQIKAISSDNRIKTASFAFSISKTTKIIGKVIRGSLYILGAVSEYIINSVSELERDALFHIAKEWRWIHTSSMPYKMEFRYTTWFSHNNQRISDEDTVTKTISFEYGDYTIS